MDDLCLNVDEGDSSLLLLLGLSAAFDTVENEYPVETLGGRSSNKGCNLDWFRFIP